MSLLLQGVQAPAQVTRVPSQRMRRGPSASDAVGATLLDMLQQLAQDASPPSSEPSAMLPDAPHPQVSAGRAQAQTSLGHAPLLQQPAVSHAGRDPGSTPAPPALPTAPLHGQPTAPEVSLAPHNSSLTASWAPSMAYLSAV